MTESLINTASSYNGESRNVLELRNLFKVPGNLDGFLHKSSMYASGRFSKLKAASTDEERQLSAKLHCYYGIPTTFLGRKALSMHPIARARTYDLRRYTISNRWGPYHDDGSMRVDWEMVESIMVILGYNSGMCCRRFLTRFRLPWSEPFEGVIPDLDRQKKLPTWNMGMLKELEAPLDSQDPYNVSGIWSRIVCFLGTSIYVSTPSQSVSSPHFRLPSYGVY